MRYYRAIIVDDHQASIDHLLEHFEKIEIIQVEGHFTDPFRALTYVRVNPVDLVILDIDLGTNMDGFDWMINSPHPGTKFILYTGYKQFEDQGYLMNAVDVLLKPVSYPRFMAAMRRVNADFRQQIPAYSDRDSLQESNSYLSVRKDARWTRELVWFRDIIYIKTSNRYVHIRMVGGKDSWLISNSPFSYIRDLLPRTWFKQCARATMFNINFFHSFRNRKMKLNQVEEYISTGDMRKYPEFLKFLENNEV